MLSFLCVLRSVSALLDLMTWKGSKLLKKPARVNFKSALCLVDICIMSQCCAFVIHRSLVSEVPTEQAMDYNIDVKVSLEGLTGFTAYHWWTADLISLYLTTEYVNNARLNWAISYTKQWIVPFFYRCRHGGCSVKKWWRPVGRPGDQSRTAGGSGLFWIRTEPVGYIPRIL